jgi:hypothetical protein
VLSPNFKSAFTTDCQAAGRASAGIPAEPPLGPRVEHRTREGEFGVVTTLIPPPGKGMLPCRSPPLLKFPCPPPRPPPPLSLNH